MNDAEALLSHGSFLRSLASALVGRDADADDLVQEAYLSAVRRPPEHPDTSRAWLARVLRNAAISRHRRETRRREREWLAARREGLPSVTEIAEKEALARRIADAVFALESPYREVILHRFYENLPPREIARREGVPVETVRTRQKRGLARLRCALDHDFGARGVWVAALAASWSVGARANAAGVSAGSAVAAGSSLSNSNLTVLGVSLMSGKITAALSAAVAVLTLGASYLYLALDSETKRADAAIADQSELDSRIETLRGENDALRASLAKARALERELRNDSAKAKSAAARAASDAAAMNSRPKRASPSDRPRTTVAEADSLAARLFARGDLEGLWILAMDLVSQGEEGYAKVVELAALLDSEAGQRFMRSRLWSEEELLVGRFLSDAFDHDEGLLRFGLYLKSEKDLPKVLGALAGEFDRHLAGILLASYQGDDDAIRAGYLDTYRTELERHRSSGEWHRARLNIHTLSQVMTPESTDYLVELLGVAPAEIKHVVIKALAWQRNEKALNALLNLDADTLDRHSREVIDAAVRLLDE